MAFIKSVSTLISGTALSQLIGFATYPLLLNFYSPDAFGVFGAYIGMVSILSTLSTLRYDQAIILAKNSKDAGQIVGLCFIIALCYSIALLFLSLIIGMVEPDSPLFGLEKRYLVFVPFLVFILSAQQVLLYFANRQKKYTQMSKVRVISASGISTAQLGLGFSSFYSVGLIIGEIVGRCLGLLFLMRHFLSQLRSVEYSYKQMRKLAFHYRKFPFFDTFSALTNVGSYHIQTVMLPIFFSSEVAGGYFVVLKLAQTPLALISGAITDVFKQKISSETDHQKLRLHFNRMFITLLVIGLIPISSLWLFGDLFIRMVLDEKWMFVCEYLKILLPMLYIRFVASPLSYFIFLRQKQNIDLVGNITLLLCAVGAIYFAKSAHEVMQYMAISFSTVYLLYILYSARLAYSAGLEK